MDLDIRTLKDFLDEKVIQYNTPDFIEHDPIQIPHMYSVKEDIEISGFLTATISWGNRKSILKSAKRMMVLMGNSPYDFIINHKDYHLDKFNGFVHRTFNADDLKVFVRGLKHLYLNMKGLEGIFAENQTPESLQPAIHKLKQEFFSIPHSTRTLKHLPDPIAGSAAKRINILMQAIKVVRNDALYS